MNSRSHITMKCSVTLLKKLVKEMGLRSSSDSGVGILPIGVTYSDFQCEGHSADWKILFNIIFRVPASSLENSFVIVRGKSPGTPDLGFLAMLILSRVSCTVITGGSGKFSFNFLWTRSGRRPISSGWYSWLISEKWSAIFSADCRLVRFSCIYWPEYLYLWDAAS